MGHLSWIILLIVNTSSPRGRANDVESDMRSLNNRENYDAELENAYTGFSSMAVQDAEMAFSTLSFSPSVESGATSDVFPIGTLMGCDSVAPMMHPDACVGAVESKSDGFSSSATGLFRTLPLMLLAAASLSDHQHFEPRGAVSTAMFASFLGFADGQTPAPTAQPTAVPTDPTAEPTANPTAEYVDHVTTPQSNSFLLDGDDSIFSNDGNTWLIFQTDGNLVLYTRTDAQSAWTASWAASWYTATIPDASGGYLALQWDGNLVVYNSTDSALWASDSYGGLALGSDAAPYYLVVSDLGYFYLLSADMTVTWASTSDAAYPTFAPPTSSPTTAEPSSDPTIDPTSKPTIDPTEIPTIDPTADPTDDPTDDPTADPTDDPTVNPTEEPTVDPTDNPTAEPTIDPTSDPTDDPTWDPSAEPTIDPTSDPTAAGVTLDPTADPTEDPTIDPTEEPSADPTTDPTNDPTQDPTADPTAIPTSEPTANPVPTAQSPTAAPIAKCGSDKGCAVNATTGVTCEYEFIADIVYGCGAGNQWSDYQNVDSVTDSDDVTICAEGFHVCGSDNDEMEEVEEIWGLTESLCTSGRDAGNPLPAGAFYVAAGKSSDGVNCNDEGGDNVFGCGDPSRSPYPMGTTSGCGPFGAVLSNDSLTADGADYGWYQSWCDSTYDCSRSEFDKLRYNGSAAWANGGVMCCRDTMSNTCQQDGALDCAGCSKYAPCLNSVDPKCITQDALDCLECEGYSACSPCAPGWDPGCFTTEWHQAEDAAFFYADGSELILNQTKYDGGRNCSLCDICDNYDEAVQIPWVYNEQPYFHPIFNFAGAGSCKTGCASECNLTDAWILGDYGMQPNINFTQPGANWLDDAFGCPANVDALNFTCTEEPQHAGEGPDASATYPDINVYDVNSTDGVCFDTTFTTDCDWNENRTCSDKVAGMCLDTGSYDAPMCPNAIHCGPEPCDMATNPQCILIEIFGSGAPCDPTEGAGEYQAFVIGDDTCRMDGSGRSYYQLGCSSRSQQFVSGVIGCTDSACSMGCTEITNMTNGTCYHNAEYAWLNELTIAALANATAICGAPTMEPTMGAPTTSPTTDSPTTSPTTDSPTTASPTTSSPTTFSPTTNYTSAPTVEPTAEPTTEPTTTTSISSSSNDTDIDFCAEQGFSDMTIEDISGVSTACNFCFVFFDRPPRDDTVECLRVGDEDADDFNPREEECFLHFCALDELCDDFAWVTFKDDALSNNLEGDSCSCDSFECVDPETTTTTEDPADDAWRVLGARVVLGVVTAMAVVY